MPQQMMKVMEEYLRHVPSDWKGWLDLAAMQLRSRLPKRATRSLEKAMMAGGNAAMATINGDRRFDVIREAAMARVRKLPGLGL
jgi:cytochrome c-type biogenesis protein CcmH/NrfG